ncbi:hypothetical protein BTVI_145409 [Pitangus sulphuratus]|nr:hypothetical protein BTVI_145409 [Pitangus sulphuratus]
MQGSRSHHVTYTLNHNMDRLQITCQLLLLEASGEAYSETGMIPEQRDDGQEMRRLEAISGGELGSVGQIYTISHSPWAIGVKSIVKNSSCDDHMTVKEGLKVSQQTRVQTKRLPLTPSQSDPLHHPNQNCMLAVPKNPTQSATDRTGESQRKLRPRGEEMSSEVFIKALFIKEHYRYTDKLNIYPSLFFSS